MFYRLFFRDGEGNPLTLSGFKDVKDDPGFDVWKDTTTLYTRILKGHVSKAEEDAARQDPATKRRWLLPPASSSSTSSTSCGSSRPSAPKAPRSPTGALALARFGALFMGKLWDVYARNVLTSSPF